MPGFVRISGTWHAVGQSAKAPFVRVSGAWRKVLGGYVRVSGSWRPWYINDSMGPAASPSYYSDFYNHQCRAVWNNPSDSDFSYMHCECYLSGTSPGNGSPVWVENVFGAPNANSQVSVNQSNNPYWSIQSWYLTGYDVNGNAGPTVITQSCGFTGSARGLVPSPITFDPTSYHLWHADNGDWDSNAGDSGANTGVFASGQKLVTDTEGGNPHQRDFAGTISYGNQFYDYLRGAYIDSAGIGIYMIDTNGSSNVRNIIFQPLNLDSDSLPSFSRGGSSFSNSNGLGSHAQAPTLSAGGPVGNANFSSDSFSYFAASDGTRVQSIFFWYPTFIGLRSPPDDDYAGMALGAGWNYAGVTGGRVTITHEG